MVGCGLLALPFFLQVAVKAYFWYNAGLLGSTLA